MPVGVWGARGVFWLVVAGGVSLRGSAVFRFGVLCVTVVGGVGGVVSRACGRGGPRWRHGGVAGRCGL